MSSLTSPVDDAKSRLRAELISRRRNRSAADLLVARAAITGHLLDSLAGLTCVAGYLPLRTEPLDDLALTQLAATARVLVPAVTGAAPLDWSEYPGPVRRAALGVDEPAGPRLGADAIGAAEAILVPALAVDRYGNRLGRGGGHYDRTLALLATVRGTAELPARIAVVFDDELLDEVPAGPLDQPVSAVLTPSGGLTVVR